MKAALLISCFLSVIEAGPVPYYFSTKLDHYSAGGEDTREFNMKYLVDTQYFSNATSGLPRPIFFYAGNEGAIETFYDNSGFMTTTLAAEMGALVVFGEHRYFGASFPFKKEEAFSEPNNSYLTVENTMMDYVELIKYIKVKYGAEDKAVITFGGSYGGMLAAWLRMKFPHVFQGALAASAPLVYFKNSTTAPEDEFSMIATADFNNTEVGPICAEGIKYALEQLNSSDSSSYDTMNDKFMPCDPITAAEQVYQLTTYLSNGFLYMAMTDYPYESSFLQPMPGFPVNASCAAFADFDPDTTSKADAWEMIKTASDTYFNYTGQITCSNINDTDATGNLDGAGWNILACNQLAMPTSMGADSMFLTEPFNYTEYTAYCEATYGLTPNYYWALDNFGGYDYTKDFVPYKNIIFSNGELDPWRAGGVTSWTNIFTPQFVIKDAAHHLDMRLPVETDKGTDVEWVREQEAMIIAQWVEDYQGPVIVPNMTHTENKLENKQFEQELNFFQ